ncbi:MAG: glucose-1-phosphate adenylyltransferase [Puniceicoccales bacterium]|jgi:glucose-1-phosphate adenylyltransferase|nr:glucose-1-phosphate adenylyltransferase [Puniceicoccales bacterium]
MGGGRGRRLDPLTKYRCKPAVPLAGKYRLVDIPISNCLNSGFNRIYILTQFNTRSLHRHIENTYRFDTFGGGKIEIFSAEQTQDNSDSWYEGTADAVRKNMRYFKAQKDDLMVILSGDQLYRMNIADLVEQHRCTGADVTIAAKAIPNERVASFGVMRVLPDLSVEEFFEKPDDLEIVEQLTMDGELRSRLKDRSSTKYSLASMGIYVFKAEVLKRTLASCGSDFGKEIIPGLLGKVAMRAYIFDDYWEDIGTVRSFFEANLGLTSFHPEFNFYDALAPIYTHPSFLPASKICHCDLQDVLVSDGCLLDEVHLKRCVLGLCSVVREGTVMENVFMMGSNCYESLEENSQEEYCVPMIGVGCHSYIRDCIIDKGARIGSHVRLTPDGKRDGFEYNGLYVRDGILCVGKDAVVPDHTIL